MNQDISNACGLGQADLRLEAANLRRFFRNFASVRASVTPPLPVSGMARRAVLVETYEPGTVNVQPSLAGKDVQRDDCCHVWQ